MVPEQKKDYCLILNDIRSSYNVGSILRTADAVGIKTVYFTGYTPFVFDRFGRPNKEIAKTALGAEKTLNIFEKKSVFVLLNKLKKDGYQIVCIEQSDKSVDYKKVKTKDKVVFVLGNEVSGVDKKILNKADVIAEIKMKGQKESLNVAISFGIAIFRILGV